MGEFTWITKAYFMLTCNANVLIVSENFIIKVGVAACSFVVSDQNNYIVQ